MSQFFQVKGGKEVLKNLQNLEKKVATKILRTELRQGAKELASEIKQDAPQGDTGKLSRSVKVRSTKRKKGQIGYEAQIGQNSFTDYYAAFVDLGTKFQEGSHFMEDAFESKHEQISDSLKDRILRAIEREADK